MVIKKYEALGCVRYTTYVEIDGKRINIDFTPGIAYYSKNASYTTDNAEIQRELEKSNAFATGLLALRSVTEKIAPPQEVVIIRENEVVDGEKEAMDESGEMEFDNLKALQMHLMKSHKVSFAEIRSRESALAKAEALGLTVKIKG